MSTPTAESSSIGPVEAFWRFRSWTVPITIVIGLLAGLVVLATTSTSTASTTLYLTDPRGTPVFRDGSSTPTDLARYARQRAEFADSAAIHEAVVRAIATDSGGDETIDSIDDAVVTGTTSTEDVRIDCTTDDDARSLVICDAVVAAYLELTAADTMRRADATVDAFLAERARLVAENGGQSTIDEIDLNIAEVRSEAALFGSGVEFVEPAEVNEDSRLLPALQYTIAALLFAAFAVAVVAWFRAGRQPVVATSSDATARLDVPLLGEITEAPAHLFDPTAPPGAAYQLLATSLGAVAPDGGIVLTATATAGSEAAETVARLAVAAAREGRRVLLIDANLHDRRVSRLFGLDQSVGGFTELIAGLTAICDVTRRIGVGGEASLDVLIGGRSVDDPAGMFRSHAARSVMHSVRDSYELILIDVPPLLTSADGSALAGESDGMILLVDRGADARDLDIVRQRLGVLRVDVLGIVYDHRAHDPAR